MDNNNNNNQYDENKKYLFKVLIIALAIIFILLIGAGILVGTFLFITNRANLNKMVQNYEIYDEAIYNKRYGDSVVKEFVNNYGADVNETDIENRTPLYHAVEANNIKAVKFLIENKADTEISSDEGITPLLLAIKNNNKKIAELLIKEGNANVYGSYTGDDIKNYPMYYAISQTNKNMIKLLLDNSFDLKREPAILSYAIENSDRSIVKYLVDNGADINYQNSDGSTVLYNSIVSLDYDLFKYFLDKGSKVENNSFNKKYGNIIMAAAGSKFNNSSSKQPVDLVLLQNGAANSAKIMNDIITNFNKNDINSYINGMNALIIASGNSYIDTVRILLENGADVNSYDNDGWTSLMYAANNGDIELAKLLISNNANVNIQSYDYSTALMCAIKSPIVKTRIPMIELLIANKADINITDANGLGALNIAIMNNDMELTKIEYAINTDNIDLLQLLVENGADINRANDISSLTPLMRASRTGLENIVRILLSRNAELNTTDKYGNTALHMAAENSQLNIVKLLLNKKPELNIQNQYGDTPLHNAVRAGSVDIVSELVIAGADINIENYNRKLPIDIARDNNSLAIYEVLKQAEDNK